MGSFENYWIISWGFLKGQIYIFDVYILNLYDFETYKKTTKIEMKSLMCKKKEFRCHFFLNLKL